MTHAHPLFAALALSLSTLVIGCIGTDAASSNESSQGPTTTGGPSAPVADGSGNATGTPCTGQGIRVMSGCVAPKGTYVALEGTEHDRIANEMWAVMAGAQCWFKQGSAQQYVFYDMLQYTFWGDYADSKSFGTLGVESVGRYEDKNAAVITMRNESWLFVVHDNQTLTIGKQLNGQPYIEVYQAHNEGRCT